MVSGWHRRDVLGLLLAVGTAPWLGCSRAGDPAPEAGGGAPEHLRVIAGAVQVAEPPVDAASAQVELDLGPERPTDAAGWDRLAASLRARVHDDFAGGRTVVAAGWLLSRTEALLAVAAA
jgi:hypothetical protein